MCSFSCVHKSLLLDTLWGCYGPGDLGSSDEFPTREAQVGIIVNHPATSQGSSGALDNLWSPLGGDSGLSGPSIESIMKTVGCEWDPVFSGVTWSTNMKKVGSK